jgi:nucleoside-diphosphate-sugar epimerase
LNDLRRQFFWKMKIAIIGIGYVGSILYDAFSYEDITVFSRTVPVFECKKFIQTDFKEITKDQLEGFDVVIFLAGLTRKGLCNSESLDYVFNENVTAVVDLARKIETSTLFLYMSTAAVYEGSGKEEMRESSTIHIESLDNYSKSMVQREIEISKLPIRSVGIRCGTIIDVSPSPKKDMCHLSMVYDAIFNKQINLKDGDAYRCIIGKNDLVQYFNLIMERHDLFLGHRIHNLGSFNCKVAKVACEIASIAKIPINTLEDECLTKGFSMDMDTIKQMGFTPRDNNVSLIQKLIDNIHDLIKCEFKVSRDLPCLICGFEQMEVVVDIGPQPLANNFTSDPQNCIAYPLKLVKCSKCHHTQLDYNVPRDILFKNYIYFSGTSKTMISYFNQFAEQVTSHFSKSTDLKVLEIASNDCSQLNSFKLLGWNTYGVDPAKNIVDTCLNKGHNLSCGFWGKDTFPELEGIIFNAIVAQNVLAHVDNPIEFIRNCTIHMNSETKLYIQTSQAEMHLRGDFDTIYHEHLSFFTMRSMLTAAKLTGCRVSDVSKVGVHGISYLFTLQLSNGTEEYSETVRNLLDFEIRSGLYDRSLYHVLSTKVNLTKRIYSKHLSSIKSSGYKIIGYGAAAKGITFLNYVSQSITDIRPDYIIDDAPQKQGLYTPISSILIKKPEDINEDKHAPLCIVVYAWNFFQEIYDKIKKLRRNSSQPTIVMVSHPTLEIWNLNKMIFKEDEVLVTTLDRLIKKKTSKVTLLSHFYNEEMLLPFWIKSHAHLFDSAILIDYQSTDNSLEMVSDIAPSTWRVIKSRNQHFDAADIDIEVMDIEATLPADSWRIVLNTTEFLLSNNLCGILSKSKDTAIEIENVFINGNDRIPLNYKQNICAQRTEFGISEGYRYIHRSPARIYNVGRHSINIPSTRTHKMFIMKFIASPWPESKARKCQIMSKVFKDLGTGVGSVHQQDENGIEKIVAEWKAKVTLDILCLNSEDPLLYYTEQLVKTTGLGWRCSSGVGRSCVYAEPTGGLGNQLFNIAATIAYGIRNNCGWKIPSTWKHSEADPAFPRHQNLIIRETCGEFFIDPESIKSTIIFREPQWNYSKIPILSGHIVLSGYYQSELYFKDEESEIRDIFYPKQSQLDRISSLLRVFEDYADCRKVAVHVRRGDYVSLSHTHYNVPVSYYRNAIQLIKKGSDKNLFVFFSDDIEFVRKEFPDIQPSVFVSDTDYNEFTLMTQCDDFIIANSSFSWWGAWLSTSEKKKVIAPAKWFGPFGPQNWQSIYRDGWIVMDDQGDILNATENLTEKCAAIDQIGHVIIISDDKDDKGYSKLKEQLGVFGFTDDKITRVSSFMDDYAGFGYSISQIYALQFTLQKPGNFFMILEDTFKFNHKTIEEINEYLDILKDTPPFDVLALSPDVRRKTFISSKDVNGKSFELSRVLESRSTSGYIVRKGYVNTLRQAAMDSIGLLRSTGQHWNYMTGIVWEKLQPIGKWYTIAEI